MEEKIFARHPDPGKAGVRISKAKYDAIRDAMLECLREEGEVRFKDMAGKVGQKLSGGFQGSISWYVTTVKLDLEARNIIERVPDARPQRLRLLVK